MKLFLQVPFFFEQFVWKQFPHKSGSHSLFRSKHGQFDERQLVLQVHPLRL